MAYTIFGGKNRRDNSIRVYCGRRFITLHRGARTLLDTPYVRLLWDREAQRVAVEASEVKSSDAYPVSKAGSISCPAFLAETHLKRGQWKCGLSA
jgi:hypothetical protein